MTKCDAYLVIDSVREKWITFNQGYEMSLPEQNKVTNFTLKCKVSE